MYFPLRVVSIFNKFIDQPILVLRMFDKEHSLPTCSFLISITMVFSLFRLLFIPSYVCVCCYHCCCCKNLAGLFTMKLYTLKMCESNGLTFRFTPPLHFAAAAFLLIQHFFLFTRISSTENIHKNHSHFIIISKMLITHFSSSSSSSVYSGYMIA